MKIKRTFLLIVVFVVLIKRRTIIAGAGAGAAAVEAEALGGHPLLSWLFEHGRSIKSLS